MVVTVNPAVKKLDSSLKLLHGEKGSVVVEVKLHTKSGEDTIWEET